MGENNRIYYGDLMAIELALTPTPDAKPSEPMPEPLTAAEFAEVGKVLDAEAADHSGDAAEKVEAPASEARQFVCPQCGSGPACWVTVASTEGGAGELRCPKCNWRGAWAEVESAKGDEQAAVLSDAFRAAAEIEAATPIATVPLTGSSAMAVELEALKQQLAAERQAREAATKANRVLRTEIDQAEAALREAGIPGADEDFRAMGLPEQIGLLRQAREAAERQATEKILELERRCNEEHYKCEAAEKRVEEAEAAIAKAMTSLEYGNFRPAYEILKAALASDAGRAAANELRALRQVAAARDRLSEVARKMMEFANSIYVPNAIFDRLGNALAELDKALAGQGEAGKEGR